MKYPVTAMILKKGLKLLRLFYIADVVLVSYNIIGNIVVFPQYTYSQKYKWYLILEGNFTVCIKTCILSIMSFYLLMPHFNTLILRK